MSAPIHGSDQPCHTNHPCTNMHSRSSTVLAHMYIHTRSHLYTYTRNTHTCTHTHAHEHTHTHTLFLRSERQTGASAAGPGWMHFLPDCHFRQCGHKRAGKQDSGQWKRRKSAGPNELWEDAPPRFDLMYPLNTLSTWWKWRYTYDCIYALLGSVAQHAANPSEYIVVVWPKTESYKLAISWGVGKELTGYIYSLTGNNCCS